jgi:hypothetical protein
MQQVALSAIDAYVRQPTPQRRAEVPVSDLMEMFADLPALDPSAFRADVDRDFDAAAHFDAYERARRAESAE